MTDNPRERMIQSALVLMGEKGVDATSFSQVISHSGAPRGSIYHHFPGGKAQLVEEATRYAGDMVANLFADAVASHDNPVAVIDAVAGFWGSILHDSDFAAGCPVLAATLDGTHSPAAREAAREAFERWEELYVQIFEHAGVPTERAHSLGATAISAIEGAVILSRAQRSNAPLERVARELQALFRGALDDARTQREGESQP